MGSDTLKIYDDLKASGIPDAQAHAQARAIGDAHKVSPEDLARVEKKTKDDLLRVEKEIRKDFEAMIQRIEQSLNWMRLIGGAMTFAFFSQGFQGWFK